MVFLSKDEFDVDEIGPDGPSKLLSTLIAQAAIRGKERLGGEDQYERVLGSWPGRIDTQAGRPSCGIGGRKAIGSGAFGRANAEFDSSLPPPSGVTWRTAAAAPLLWAAVGPYAPRGFAITTSEN